MHVILFTVERHCFAVPLKNTEKAILAVETTSLGLMSPKILGMIDFHGVIIPIVNVRELFNLPQRELELTDYFLICQVQGKHFGLWVDSVSGVDEYDESHIDTSQIPAVQGRYVENMISGKEIMAMISLDKICKECLDAK